MIYRENMLEFTREFQLEPKTHKFERRFEQAVERAITSSKQSGNDPDHHFVSAGKMAEQTRIRR